MKGQRVSPAHRCARGDRPNLFSVSAATVGASLMTAKSTTCLSTPLLMPNGERLRAQPRLPGGSRESANQERSPSDDEAGDG
jgi:hypothetical protein